MSQLVLGDVVFDHQFQHILETSSILRLREPDAERESGWVGDREFDVSMLVNFDQRLDKAGRDSGAAGFLLQLLNAVFDGRYSGDDVMSRSWCDDFVEVAIVVVASCLRLFDRIVSLVQ